MVSLIPGSLAFCEVRQTLLVHHGARACAEVFHPGYNPAIVMMIRLSESRDSTDVLFLSHRPKESESGRKTRPVSRVF